MADRPIPLFERLLIETQSHCNRDCWFCARTYDASGKYLQPDGQPVRRRMATDLVLNVLDQAQALGFTGLVGFHHYSEPLLDKRHLQFAAAARACGMQPYLHTNGDVLAGDPGLCEQVQEYYVRVVIGLYDHRSAVELEDMKQSWRRCLPRVELQFSIIGPGHDRNLPSNAIPRALVPSDPRMRVPDLVFPNAPCLRPFIRMIIQYDGTMCLCCDDTSGAFTLGNIHNQGVEALWFSQRHVNILKELAQGQREQFGLCSNCPQSPSGQRPDKQKIRFSRRPGSNGRWGDTSANKSGGERLRPALSVE